MACPHCALGPLTLPYPLQRMLNEQKRLLGEIDAEMESVRRAAEQAAKQYAEKIKEAKKAKAEAEAKVLRSGSR
jgi:hypothetical protein